MGFPYKKLNFQPQEFIMILYNNYFFINIPTLFNTKIYIFKSSCLQVVHLIQETLYFYVNT